MEYVNFQKALEAALEGSMIKRSGWNHHTFVFKQKDNSVLAESIKGMISLPESVKVEMVKRKQTGKEEFQNLRYSSQFIMVNEFNLFTNYNFTGLDVTAVDWIIIE